MSANSIPVLTTHVEHLPLTDELRLRKIARRYIDDYPDARSTAYTTALAILKKHTRRRLSPDKVYWHRFTGAASSSRTFTGWEHSGKPVESMTLVELVLHRFGARDQDEAEDLQVYGGFYTDDAQHGTYDERNEVAMLPQKVLRDFWDVNFSNAYQRKVEQFWVTHRENFRTLSKAHLLAAAGQARRNGSLPEGDYQRVLQAVGTGPSAAMTLNGLRARCAVPEGVSWRSFDIGEYLAHDIVRIVEPAGRQILYVPGQAPAFHCFDSDAQLAAWVLDRCATATSRSAFTLHFFPSQNAKDQDGAGFDRWIGQLQRNEWSDQKVINRLDQVISGDVFEHLGELAGRNMKVQAGMLTSNASLRKQMWMGYLNAFLKLAGAAGPLGWPVALTLIGAGLTNVGLQIDQAINGNTPGLRKAGVLGAVFNSIFVAFNLPGLAGIRGVSTVQDWVPVAEGESEEALAPLRGNLILDTEPVLANAETWIEIRGLPYRVVYSEHLASWTIVDPLNPFAFQGARPVRLNAQDEWELLAAPGLRGGAPMQALPGPPTELAAAPPYVTTRSAFWDTYMGFDLAQEERLSKVALARQKAIVDETIRECDVNPESPADSETDSDPDPDPDEYVTTNEEGDRVLIDPWGDEQRVFKYRDDYIGGGVTDYARDDELCNVYLRTGESKYANQVQLIEQLVDDIDIIGCNNDVDLYRGGSGDRGTSGIAFRSGHINPGDILVNTDFTSFSENPYLARVFSSSQGGLQSQIFERQLAEGKEITFDDTSVVFHLPQKSYLSATPIAPFSGDWQEAESLFKPGNYFQIDSIEEVVGERFKFIKVQMRQVYAELYRNAPAGVRIFDMRTGVPFVRADYAKILGPQGAGLVEEFFPLADTRTA
jgi:hypothetical protein